MSCVCFPLVHPRSLDERPFWHLPRVRAVCMRRKEALKERPKCKTPVACASTPPRIARRGNVGNVWNRSWEYERTVHREDEAMSIAEGTIENRVANEMRNSTGEARSFRSFVEARIDTRSHLHRLTASVISVVGLSSEKRGNKYLDRYKFDLNLSTTHTK